METTIRFASPSESECLSEIALKSKRYWNYPDQWFDLWVDMFKISGDFISRNLVWVAEIENKIIGFLAMSTKNRVSEIEHMWILPDCMGKGIGKQLFHSMLDYCQSNGIVRVRIESDPNAKGFYEKMGAIQVGFVDSIPSPRKLPVLVVDLEIANN